MSLSSRKEGFDILASRFTNDRPNNLILSYKPSASATKKLQLATCLYISKTIGNDICITDETELLKTLNKHYDNIPNITPNGLIVPKRHLVIEYNLLVSAFINIVNELNINDLISSWHVPLNLRYKQGEVNQANMTRHHPTEHIHSDSWAGESTESVTIMVPIFGDTAHNRVKYYKPPNSFQEEWLGPLPSYKDGKKYAEQYTDIDFIAPKSNLILADFATLHASHRNSDAKDRISIDTTFVLKKPGDYREPEKIHEWREGERANPDDLVNLGSNQLLYFPDRNDEWVDSQGGFKHPSNLQMVDLYESIRLTNNSA